MQPESGFASPASGVLAPEEDVTVTEDYPARRRSTRKDGQRDALFRRRLQKQGHRDMLYELREDGTYEMKEMSIREVFNYVQGQFRVVFCCISWLFFLRKHGFVIFYRVFEDFSGSIFVSALNSTSMYPFWGWSACDHGRRPHKYTLIGVVTTEGVRVR